jgi:voltage-gated potassium channel
MNLRRGLAYALAALLAMAVLSVSGYCLLGGANVTFLQALYMAVITLCGVGYQEIVDTSHKPALRVFNIFVVLFGVAIMVYVFSVVTAFLVEGELSNLFWRRRETDQRTNRPLHHLRFGRHPKIYCGRTAGLGDALRGD